MCATADGRVFPKEVSLKCGRGSHASDGVNGAEGAKASSSMATKRDPGELHNLAGDDQEKVVARMKPPLSIGRRAPKLGHHSRPGEHTP